MSIKNQIEILIINNAESLAQLSDDFATYSTQYAETIVHELSLPMDLKSITQVDIGGVAGGSKYITWLVRFYCMYVIFQFHALQIRCRR